VTAPERIDEGVPTDERLIIVGRLGRPHGLSGWCHVHAWTRPPENLGQYGAWWVGRDGRWQARPLAPLRFEAHGKSHIVCFVGVDSREDAQALVGMDVAVPRSALPAPEPGEYYWMDLIGLEVFVGERCLGRVDHLLETGSNDVLVVQGERERLIPFILDRFVLRVDLDRQRIEVDWDPEF